MKMNKRRCEIKEKSEWLPNTKKARQEWRPNENLAKALHPSTSKGYVLPRCFRFTSIGQGKEIGHVLKNFYEIEKLHLPSKDYFKCVQTKITIDMRTMVVEWMLEVCTSEDCSVEIFPLSVQYFDRFLSIEAIHKDQLQVLGTTCLFLASKVKLTMPFNASRLCQYTDDSVSISDLLSWELLVLNRLNWDLASLTAFDFLDQYLPYLERKIDALTLKEARPKLNFMVAQAAINFETACLLPSKIAQDLYTILFQNIQSQCA